MAISGLDKKALTAAYLEKMKSDAGRRAELRDQTSRELRDVDQAQRAKTMRWGNDAMQGATTGMSFGGPWGALIGGIIGGGMGMYRATRAREAEGKDLGDAFLTTLGDFDNSLPGLDTYAPMASAVGQYNNKLKYDKQLAESAEQNKKLIDSINNYTKSMQAKNIELVPDNEATPSLYPDVDSYEWNRRHAQPY